jgi:hypothetical protein
MPETLWHHLTTNFSFIMKNLQILVSSLVLLLVSGLVFWACQKSPEERSGKQVSPTALVEVSSVDLSRETDDYLFYHVGVHQSEFCLPKKQSNVAAIKNLIQSEGLAGVKVFFATDDKVEVDGYSYFRIQHVEPATPEEQQILKDSFVPDDAGTGATDRLSSTLPNYNTVVSVFNDLKGRNCSVLLQSPCIPFDYIADGCYARAHAMKRRMEVQNGYTCNKIFSFGTLRAKSPLNGCCASWVYHVAPLVYVGSTKYVLDPSMFSTPVSVTTWTNAQKITSCSTSAAVTSTAIKSGSHYAYNNSTGQYVFDNNYTNTDYICNAYALLSGCN